MLLLFGTLGISFALTLAADPITINATLLSRLFDGIGGLSGGGATSRLLRDYPPDQAAAVFDLLFKPKYGAALQIVKVEIGGDTFSGCGTEPSHMHTADDLGVRGYEWWVLQQAKKRNPDVRTYGLPWGFPAWIGRGALNANQALYTTRWAQLARQQGLTVDFLGIWNEDSYSADYVKLLRRSLDEAQFNQTHLVVADNALPSMDVIAADMEADPQFAAAVDVIGVHYPLAGTSSAAGVAADAALWSSEDSSTHDDAVGGGCWAHRLNNNWVKGSYTATIMWNLVSSYYEPLRWFGDSMLNAAQPWSGSFSVKSPVWISAHTTQFTSPGWHYLPVGGSGGSGQLPRGGTYVTLVSAKDTTIVLETMTYNHSLCIRDNAQTPWEVQPQNLTLRLVNLPENPTSLTVWRTVLFSGGVATNDSQWFIQEADVAVVDGTVSMFLDVDTVVTLSTTTGQSKGSREAPSPSPFPMPFAAPLTTGVNDTFAPYFSDMAGSFSYRQSPSNASEMALTQVVLQSPSVAGTAWHGQDSKQPLTIVGDYNTTDVFVNVTVYMEASAHSGGAPLLSLRACDTTPDQVWVWNTSTLPGSLRNGPLGACVDVDGCKPLEGTAVWMWPCVNTTAANCGSRNQQWSLTPSGQLRTAMKTAFCLTAPSLTMEPCVSPQPVSQTWKYDASSQAVVAAGGECLSSLPPAPAPGHDAVTNAVVAARVGGPLRSCGPRESACVTAYSSLFYDYGVFFTVWANGTWAVNSGPSVLASGDGLPVGLHQWFRMGLSVVGDTVTPYLNDTPLGSTPGANLTNGWAGLGSSWSPVAFQDFSMAAV